MWGLDWILNVLSIIFRHWWMFEQSMPKWSSLCQPSGKLSLRLQDWLHWKPVPNRYEQSVNKITKLDQVLCSSIDAEEWNRVCNIPCAMSLIQLILLTVTCDSLHQYSLIVKHNQRPFSSYIKVVYSTVIDGVLTYYPLQKWNFQTSTSVHRHHAKMEVHALISLEASAVIARRSSREQTAKTQQVLITYINKHNP